MGRSLGWKRAGGSELAGAKEVSGAEGRKLGIV